MCVSLDICIRCSHSMTYMYHDHDYLYKQTDSVIDTIDLFLWFTHYMFCSGQQFNSGSTLNSSIWPKFVRFWYRMLSKLLVFFQIENKVFRSERYQIAAKTLLRGATLELEHRCAYMYICRNLFNNNFSHKNAIHNSTKHEISYRVAIDI